MADTYTQLLYHLVFGTKNRYPYLSRELREPLFRYIRGIVSDLGGVVVAVGGVEDHIHLLLSLRAQPALSDVAHQIKGGSSRWLNQTGRLTDHFGWQDGYAAFTVSVSQVPTLVRYIENQEQHHQRSGFDREATSSGRSMS